MRFVQLLFRNVIRKRSILQNSSVAYREQSVLSWSRGYATSSSDSVVKTDPAVIESVTSLESPQSAIISPENSKLLKIAIVGVPNAGKSTITNALTKYDVCPVSKRPHTTRLNQHAIYLDNETQLVFVDTPGLVSIREIKKFAFSETFVYGPEKSIGTANIIAVIHDVSNSVACDKLDFRIKGLLRKFPDKKTILILNKVDLVKRKSALLECLRYLTCGIVGGKPLPMLTFEERKRRTVNPKARLNTEEFLANAKRRQLQLAEDRVPTTSFDLANKLFSEWEVNKGLHELGWPNFSDIFMVSALEEDGIDLLRRYLVVNAKPQKWIYNSDTLTNVLPTTLAIQIMKAKLLDFLPQEMPFKVVPEIEFWDENDQGILCVGIRIRCPKEKYKWRIVGSENTVLKQITQETQSALISVMCRQVNLTINPIVDKRLESNT